MTDRDPGTARHTEAGMVRLGRMQTRAWSPGRRKEKEGEGRTGTGGQTDTETRAAQATAETRQAGMEEGSRIRENRDRGTVGQRHPDCAGHGLGLAPRVE